MHDNMVKLFPEYWQNVPMDFEFIFAGEVYPWGEQKDEAVHGESDTPTSYISAQYTDSVQTQVLVWGWEVRRDRQPPHKTGRNKALLCESLQ